MNYVCNKGLWINSNILILGWKFTPLLDCRTVNNTRIFILNWSPKEFIVDTCRCVTMRIQHFTPNIQFAEFRTCTHFVFVPFSKTLNFPPFIMLSIKSVAQHAYAPFLRHAYEITAKRKYALGMLVQIKIGVKSRGEGVGGGVGNVKQREYGKSWTRMSVCVIAGLNGITVRDFSIWPFFRPGFLTKSFKLRGVYTDFLCERPKFAFQKNIHVFCARFRVDTKPQFFNISLLFSGICYT